jgi:hypothetical protein
MNGKVWQLIVKCSHHNYELFIDPAAYPVLRKLEKDLIFKATVKA